MQDNLNVLNSDLDEDTLKGKYLTFYTDNQLLGISIADVVQIVGMQEITAVPEFPSYAKGVINLRGIIIPIIDVRLRLKKEEIGYNERTCIIVTNINESYIGFIVDEVNEVTNIDNENISDPPKMGSDYTNTFITGIAKLNNRIVLLIDLKKVLDEKEIELITNVN
ncbi:purine-binding chemotaxis protein CheW [Sedimentibacter hydroxybenzoicus DSM 7310]|uniref:Purine-binding chemotaxis protein CheW n=1 Tax=Sedimentibacter hydroxybenzoicus DSM 7310 TaxID=1123245 RepID=A0A974GUS5_SEDHY|nr:chemotaxis protein CheW [Sedimentibacter hydroxybenzoicus]NYB72577.1 purine-binding chemotaxis protein CheW [Sedimentibacter hydroxybenzoicus DSM 7310]